MTAILVSHPHVAAVSAGLAACLEDQGKLAAYFTGIAFASDGWTGHLAGWSAQRWPTIQNRIVPGVRPEHLRTNASVEMSARMTARLACGLVPDLGLYNAIFTAHDRAVSWARWPREASAIYAYEDAALWTFRRAARADLGRIWDLPLPHYRTIEETLSAEFHRWPAAALGAPHREPEWKQRRKDHELSLASKISVASAFTRKSLERFDLQVPIVVTPYGFPVDTFPARPRAPVGPFTVLSVGTHDLRKGTPYLLEAWKRAAIPNAQLHLVGPLRLAKGFLDGFAGTFQHWPHVPKSELGARYAGADLLVFPTLGDGFGLVIQEAMSSGTPVVTTPCGGGPECITDGADGWIVPPRDIDALTDRLRRCAADRDHVAEIGRAARARAERWTWRDTSRALAELVE